MIEISFIRHAPTDSNLNQIFMGTLDKPCNAEGLAAAKAAAAKLENQSFDIYYSSPLIRAKQTTELLFPNKPIRYDNRLMERGLGIWEGRRKEQVYNEFPEAFNNAKLKFEFYPEGGEPYDKSINKAYSFLKDLVEFEDETRIAAVSHNGTLAILIALLTRQDLRDTNVRKLNHLEPYRYEISRGDIDIIKTFAIEQIKKMDAIIGDNGCCNFDKTY